LSDKNAFKQNQAGLQAFKMSFFNITSFEKHVWLQWIIICFSKDNWPYLGSLAFLKMKMPMLWCKGIFNAKRIENGMHMKCFRLEKCC